jgi:hypothetical protein
MPEVRAFNPNAQRGPWCVVCTAEKHSDNHWFEAEVLLASGRGPELQIRRLQLPLQPHCDPICGEKCLQKRVSIWASSHLLMPRQIPEAR